MNSDLIVFIILGIAFVAVALHLVLYSRRRSATLRRFADLHGYPYEVQDNGTLERQLGNAFGIQESQCARAFGQVGDIVSFPDGIIFNAVELLDLNPHGSAANSHHPRTAVLFSVSSKWFGIFHVTPGGLVHARYPQGAAEEGKAVQEFVQRVKMAKPPCPMSLTLMHGLALAYLEPAVVGSVKSGHLDYLADVAACFARHGVKSLRPQRGS